MGKEDTITITLPHDMDEDWLNTTTTIPSTTDSVFTITSPEVFTRYPDLDAKSVQQGLGVDVVSDLRKILDESK